MNVKAEAWNKVAEAVAEGDVEATLERLADWFAADRLNETLHDNNPTVVALLRDCEDEMRDIAMKFYVSTK